MLRKIAWPATSRRRCARAGCRPRKRGRWGTRPSSPAAVAEASAPGRAAAAVSDVDADPTKLIPLEVARANLLHWWREPIAGVIAVGIGSWDAWHFGRDAGLSSSFDELLLIGGVVLIAGSKRLFSGAASASPSEDNK